MKKTLMLVSCGVAVAMTFGLCTVAIRQAFGDSCTGCISGNPYVVWAASPSSTNADGSGVFQEDLLFEWAYESPPTLGQMSFLSGISTNIDTPTVAYTPDYLTNPEECCSGSVTIQVDGELDTNTVDGTLKTKGDFWPPYRDATKTLHVDENA